MNRRTGTRTFSNESSLGGRHVGPNVRRAFVWLLPLGVMLAALAACNQDRATATRRLNEGLQLQNTGQTERAMKKFERAAEIDSSFAKPYFMLGQLRQVEFSSPDSAEEDYRNALQRDPGNAKYAYHLGSVLSEQGYHREAIKYFRQAIDNRDGYAEAYYRMGESLRARGNQPKALRAYMDSIRANPRLKIGEEGMPGIAYNALGNLYLEYGFFDKALKVFDNGIQNNSDSARLYHGKGVAQLELERYDQAIDSFEKAAERRKKYASAYFNMAAAYRQLDRPEDAISALETFMESAGGGGDRARMSAARGLIQEIEQEKQDDEQ